MIYNFDEIIDRSGTDSVRWEVLPEGTPPQVLPLWVADMDFTCPEPVLAALRKRIDKKIMGYTVNDGSRIKDAVHSWYKKRFGWSIEKSWIFYSSGIVPAIAFLVNALTNEGDGIIIQRPVYYPFSKIIADNKRVIVNNALVRQGTSYVINFEDLENKFADPKNKGLIFCSPHNPTGRVWTEDELRKVVAIAKKYEKWIISDEIHCDLTRAGIKHTPLLKAAPEYKNRIIACVSTAKTFNIAGMHLSSTIIPNPEYQKKWSEFTLTKKLLSDVCSPLSLEAVIAAYNEGEEWLDQARAYIDANIKYVDEFLKKNLPKATFIDCEGTYLAWIDLREYCSDHKKLEEAMIHKAKLILDEGYIFGEEGIGYERINLATPRASVVECMERLKTAVLDLSRDESK